MRCARLEMVTRQIEARGVTTARVLDVLRWVPRHLFISAEDMPLAYADHPLPIGGGQTISQPYIVALMTDLLRLGGGESVLEIGTGSGYQAAVLACLARQVHTIELHAELADRARSVLQRLGLENVTVHTGDGSFGLPEFAPYQGILAAAAAPRVPPPVLDQLDTGGRLVMPVGRRGSQYLEVWERTGLGLISDTVLPVAFVPLRGAWGWSLQEW
jgi:protein-L-isoaspartate(D-aspartate) O-methyltransferase